jgi:uncharacterized membrane protein
MKKVSLYLMMVLYISAGINHFLNTHFYEAIMPGYIGLHNLLIYISGVCEIMLGVLLLPQNTRKLSALLIVGMLIVFLWLHVQMLIDYWKYSDKDLWIAMLRIPLQFGLMVWAYSFTYSPKSAANKPEHGL